MRIPLFAAGALPYKPVFHYVAQAVQPGITGGVPPTGPAGGDLTGTYPDPDIAANAVTSAEIAPDAVGSSELADNAVDTNAVQDGAVTPAKLSFDPATQAELDAHITDAVDAHDASAISNVPAGGIAATDVQTALNELDTEKANLASAVMDGDAAGGVLGGTYPNPSFAADMATQAELDAHINDATDAHDASAISNVAAGGIVATDVQAAINELDTEKVSTTTFNDHSARHENGGADEISVAGLSGELADAQPVTVRKNTGADVGTRSRLNFIEGSNVTLTIADDAGGDEVDITIASSGSGAVSYDDEDLILHARSLG